LYRVTKRLLLYHQTWHGPTPVGKRAYEKQQSDLKQVVLICALVEGGRDRGCVGCKCSYLRGGLAEKSLTSYWIWTARGRMVQSHKWGFDCCLFSSSATGKNALMKRTRKFHWSRWRPVLM
jgi:hypothetical protein